MSTHIKGFIPDTDAEYQRHKKVLLICHEMEVHLPPETAEYFGHGVPHLSLLEEKLEMELIENVNYKYWDDTEEGSQGFEVDLTQLPPGVTKLRFYNNW